MIRYEKEAGMRCHGPVRARQPVGAALVLAVVAGLGFSNPAQAQGNGGFTSGDLHAMQSVGDVKLSPDGRRVAYTVQNREGPGRAYSQIWILEVRSGESQRLGPADARTSAPRWSPDGEWLLYSGSLNGRSGLIVSRADGRDARFIAEVRGTNHPLPSQGERVAWSPDGRQVAFVSATDGPEGPEEGADGDPIVIRRYLYKTSGSDGVSYFNDNRRLHIFVADIASGAVRQITRGNGYHHSIDWSPDGREILFVSNLEPDPDRFFNYDVSAVSLADGAIRNLTRLESVVYRPRWSPDGRRVAYQGTRRGLTSSETTMEDTRIWVMDADGSNARELGGALDNRQGAPAWSPDGRWIYFTVLTRGNVHLFRLPAAGGPPEAVIADRGRVSSWSIGAGDQVAYAFHSPSDMAQLHVRAGRQQRQLTDLNRDVLAGRRIAEVESLTFVSFDGLEMEAFLTRPLGRTAESRHPMIVMIKGGPHSQQGPSYNHTAQVYANQGWATLMVNYRGSTGYGQAFTDAIFGDQNGAEAKDVLQGVEVAMRRNPWIDRNRIGVEGGSYGGQLSNWLITQTRRFAAAIPRAGISDLVSHNYLSYYHDYLAVEYGGFPHQADIMDRLWERSPIRHVAKVSTPTMLVHGANDHNVPTSQAEQFFIALRDVGVEAELVLYPRAGHGIAEVGQQVDLIDRSIGWYLRHFRSPGV